MNTTHLIGRITKQLELKKSTGDKNYVTFKIAVNEIFNGKKNTQFVPCVAWGKIAEAIVKYTTKGSQVAVEAGVSIQNIEEKETKTWKTEIIFIIKRIKFLDQNKKVENETLNVESKTTAKNDIDEVVLSDDESILWD